MINPKPFWNPYVAGIGLGLVLLFSFFMTGKGLGASGIVKRLQAATIHSVNPTWAEESPNIGSYFNPGTSPFNAWIVFLVIGIAIGGAASAINGRRIKVETIHGPRTSKETRWILAIAGGLISGFAAQMARGCTSGQALTGGAQLVLGSWIFMFAVFAGAYGLAYFMRKQWI